MYACPKCPCSRCEYIRSLNLKEVERRMILEWFWQKAGDDPAKGLEIIKEIKHLLKKGGKK